MNVLHLKKKKKRISNWYSLFLVVMLYLRLHGNHSQAGGHKPWKVIPVHLKKQIYRKLNSYKFSTNLMSKFKDHGIRLLVRQPVWRRACMATKI